MVHGPTRHWRRLVAGAAIAAFVVTGESALSARTAQSAEHPSTADRALAAGAGQVVVGAGTVALNQPAEPYLGKVAPAATAAVSGMYSSLAAWPLVGIHLTLLPNGHVVSYGSPVGVAQQGGLSYDDWDPAVGSGSGAHRQAASMHQYDSFCNALEQLPDGRLLMVGGNSSSAT